MDDDFFIKHAGAKDEIFKEVKEFEENYLISSKGYIFSLRSDVIWKFALE